MLQNKLKLNYIVDTLMFICFLFSAISGILFLFIPKGPGAGWYRLEILERGNLKDFHIIFGVLMIVLGLIHFILHLKWVIAITKDFLGKNKNQ